MLATVMLTSVITAIDATIANVVLPHMQGSLAATQDQIAWVLTSYVVAAAVCTPPTAWLAARFGQRRVLTTSVIGFLIASMLCGTATSLPQMVAFRMLQGAFGASMLPLGQAIVLNAFPPEKHGKVLAIWSLGAMVGPICGPSLGGYITEALNWRWVFYVNAPLCLLALAGVLLFIPESKRGSNTRFDVFGFGLLSIALMAFQLMLDRGQSLNWFESTEIIVEGCVAALCLYLFIVHILTAKQTPFIEPRLFANRNFVLGLATVVLLHMMMMGQMALLPVYLQSLMQKPVDHVGLLMIPRGVAALAGTLLVGRLTGLVPNRWLMVTGFSMLGWSMYEMSTINLYISDATIIAIGLVQGVGAGLALVPLTTAAYATLPPELRTEGTSMYTLVRNLGSSVGISVMFARVAQLTQVHHQQIGEHITVFSSPGTLSPMWDINSVSGAMLLDAELTRQAASLGYLNSYLLMAGMMVIAIPLCLLFRETPRRKDDDFPLIAADH
jgi:DHA2 family multidrug resistance protein